MLPGTMFSADNFVASHSCEKCSVSAKQCWGHADLMFLLLIIPFLFNLNFYFWFILKGDRRFTGFNKVCRKWRRKLVGLCSEGEYIEVIIYDVSISFEGLGEVTEC